MTGTERTIPIPEHITPRSIFDMPSVDLDALLEGIRQRRLSAARQYEAAQKAAKEAADEKARTQLLKQCEMLGNALETVAKSLDRMETRVTKIRALRLELGLD